MLFLIFGESWAVPELSRFGHGPYFRLGKSGRRLNEDAPMDLARAIKRAAASLPISQNENEYELIGQP
jgi:hypothetical protein